MQVLAKLRVAPFLVDFAQPLNHHLAVLAINPIYTLNINCNKYVTPVHMTKEDIISRVYIDMSGFGSLKQTLQRGQGGGSIYQARRCTSMDGSEHEEETAAQRAEQLRRQRSLPRIPTRSDLY